MTDGETIKASEKPASAEEKQQAPQPTTQEKVEEEKQAGAKEKIEEKREAKKEKKEEIVLQRKFTIPLVKAYAKPAKKRASRAVKLVRKFAARHAKTTLDKVKIDTKISEFINARGAKRPPKKLKISLVKDKQGIVKVLPA